MKMCEGWIWRWVSFASSGASHGARMYNFILNYCMWADVAGMQDVSLGWLMCIFCVQVGFRERHIVLIHGYTENGNMSKSIGTIGTSNFEYISVDHSDSFIKLAENEWKLPKDDELFPFVVSDYDASDYDASSQCWCWCKGFVLTLRDPPPLTPPRQTGGRQGNKQLVECHCVRCVSSGRVYQLCPFVELARLCGWHPEMSVCFFYGQKSELLARTSCSSPWQDRTTSSLMVPDVVDVGTIDYQWMSPPSGLWHDWNPFWNVYKIECFPEYKHPAYIILFVMNR
jgi:hypothetical protein